MTFDNDLLIANNEKENYKIEKNVKELKKKKKKQSKKIASLLISTIVESIGLACYQEVKMPITILSLIESWNMEIF